MASVQITCGTSTRILLCEPGTNLLEVLRTNGYEIPAHCSGRGHCGKCNVLINGRSVLSCQITVQDGMSITIPQPMNQLSILTEGSHLPIQPDGTDRYVAALDIGTTTLVAYLLDGSTGSVLQTASRLNPQGSYGADVISRIAYAQHGGAAQLQQVIQDALCAMLLEVSAQEGITPLEITAICAVGNTAMHHLFLGIDTESLVVPPYMPAVRSLLEMEAVCVLPVLTNARLRILPNIAGFVGADTVGCLAASQFDLRNATTLLLDIGTNGEMVLDTGSRRIACSTAAGPAFEGADICCGMRGSAGAIDHAFWDADGSIQYHVLGEGPAKGICGSGLVDIVYALLKTGRINSAGRITAADCHRDEAGRKFFLLKDGIRLTQQDIRQLQLAKAAIRSGIELMAQELGLAVSCIQRVYLAGAFGNYLDAASACGIGLIPQVLADRIVPIGNAAGTGAKICALNRDCFESTAALAQETEFLELSSSRAFQSVYLKNLNFGS